MRPGKPAPLSGLLIMVILLAAFTLNGCGTIGSIIKAWINQKALEDSFENHPSASALRQLRPEDTYLLSGEVTYKGKQPKPEGPVLLAVVTDKYQKREVALTKILQAPVKTYSVFLLEDSYDLYFFADLGEKNGFFEASETIGQTSGATVNVTRAAVKDGVTFEGPVVSLDPDNPTTSDLSILEEVKKRSYVFYSLDDEFFDEDYGELGLTDPEKFAAHTQGNFFSLEEFDPNKTMVLFVHGTKGTPRDFKDLVEGLDRKRFQPWFYYYASYLPVQKLGGFLADAIDYIGKSFDPRLIVVAHSMGGLVALSAMNELCADGKPPYLKGYISFDSPYGGVEAAKNSDHLPGKIPSWLDVAPHSDFLKTLYQGKATTTIPFHLFFGYKTGESGDGDITLQSQLDHRVHFNATKCYGFNATHVGIVNDPQSRQQFLRVLDVLDR